MAFFKIAASLGVFRLNTYFSLVNYQNVVIFIFIYFVESKHKTNRKLHYLKQLTYLTGQPW